MPQVINGVLLGSPGPTGSRGIYILTSAVDPDASTDPNALGAQLGSLLINYVLATLWQKTDLTTSVAHPNGVWTQIS